VRTCPIRVYCGNGYCAGVCGITPRYGGNGDSTSRTPAVEVDRMFGSEFGFGSECGEFMALGQYSASAECGFSTFDLTFGFALL